MEKLPSDPPHPFTLPAYNYDPFSSYISLPQGLSQKACACLVLTSDDMKRVSFQKKLAVYMKLVERHHPDMTLSEVVTKAEVASTFMEFIWYDVMPAHLLKAAIHTFLLTDKNGCQPWLLPSYCPDYTLPPMPFKLDVYQQNVKFIGAIDPLPSWFLIQTTERKRFILHCNRNLNTLIHAYPVRKPMTISTRSNTIPFAIGGTISCPLEMTEGRQTLYISSLSSPHLPAISCSIVEVGISEPAENWWTADKGGVQSNGSVLPSLDMV